MRHFVMISFERPKIEVAIEAFRNYFLHFVLVPFEHEKY